MATTTNSFQALLGAGGEAAVNAGSKKKKKNKSKKLAANDLQAGAVNPDNTSQTRGSKVSNDTSQVVSLGKHSGNDMKSFTGANISAEEAVKHVEKTVKETALVNAGRLWKAWGTELEAVKVGQGIKYLASDGSTLNFKEVLMKSSALEMAAESALVMDSNALQYDLAHLFSLCLPPSSDFVPETLSELVFRLGHLLPSTNSHMIEAAKQAVHAVIGALKACNDGSSNTPSNKDWLARLHAIDNALDVQDSFLQKLRHCAPAAGVLKEQVDITDQIVRLSEEKLDLLRAGCYASETGTSRAADKANAAIQDLRVLIQGSGNSTLKKKSLRSFEDADQLQKRRSDLKEDIEAAESKLQRLRMELIDVELQISMGGINVEGQPPDFQQQLVAVDALGALVQLSRDANVSLEVEAEAVSRATEAGAPAALLAAIESNFQAMVGMLTEVLHNLQSSLEKLARNKRQAQQLLEMGDASSAIASNRRVKDELERMMDRMEMDVELIMKKMHKTIDRLQSRKEILKKFPGHAARLRVYRSIEELAEQMQQLHEHILSGLAKRTGQEGKKGNSRLLMSESDDLSSEDRVHQLEEMLKVANATLQQKDAQLAKLKSSSPGASLNGSGHVSSGNPCRPSIQGSDSLPPPIVDMAQTTFSPHPSDLTPQPALPALIESIPVAMMSADVSRAPGLVLENVPVQASGSIRVQPKATPRVWGKVESAPVVLDDTLPSLADAVAASHKGKRGARR